MKKILTMVIAVLMGVGSAYAHEDEQPVDSNAIVTNPFWSNWYGQVGIDMNLLFPKGHDMMDVFPNGKSMGVTVAAGKWFSHEFGARLKVSWENGILSNDHNTWLAPYGVAGQNHREGGFITFLGDINLNLFNLLGEYKPERKWDLIVAPRAGGWIDFGTSSGAPVLGIAVINTYRLNDKWKLFADAGYHFVSSVNGVASGTGHGSNTYGEICVGVEMDLSSENKFHRLSENHSSKGTVLNSFWENWFVQAGLGMFLVNPYGTNFSNVFPNGHTSGVCVGLGKWFSPEVGVRGGLNWQNGLVANHHASYLDPLDKSRTDYYRDVVSFYGDLFFNLHNIIAGYDDSRRWNAIFFPRMGVGWNRASEYKECPVLGFGTEHTYQVSDRMKLFADLAYQVTTGGFLDTKYETGDGPNTNGWLDFSIGIQYDLGKNKWKKTR